MLVRIRNTLIPIPIKICFRYALEISIKLPPQYPKKRLVCGSLQIFFFFCFFKTFYGETGTAF